MLRCSGLMAEALVEAPEPCDAISRWVPVNLYNQIKQKFSALKPNYIAVLLICLRTRFFFFIPTGQTDFAPCEKLRIQES